MDGKQLYNESSDSIIAEIERNESCFKFIPTEIGELKFCGSTNYKACADDGSVRKKQYAKAVAVFVSIPIVSCLIFSNSPIWNSILAVGCLVGFILTAKKIASFKGSDYFVGTKGFCHVDFNGTRDNITTSVTVLFDNVSDLLTEQVHIKRNGSYSETQYYISFVSDKDNQVVFYDSGSYDKSYPDLTRVFYDKVIDNWKNYKLKDLGKIPMSFNAFQMKEGAVEKSLLPYIVVEDDHIKVHGQEYYYKDIKQMKFEATNAGMGLLIEHKNHEVVKKSFWRKSETGDVEHIPLAAVGNQEFFIAYFSWLISTKGLLNDKE